jgi:hypothetical protein
MIKKLFVIFFVLMLIFSLVASVSALIDKHYNLFIVFSFLILIFSYNLRRLSKNK